MKSKSRPFFVVSSLPLAICLAFGPIAQGALFWDGGTTGGTGDGASAGGTGTWSTAVQNWDAGNGIARVVWTNGNDAVFGGSGGTVTLGTAISAGNIAISNNNYTLDTAGGAGLTLANGITTSGSFFHQISGAGGLALSGSTQTFDITGALNISTAVSGSATITKTGAGFLSLSNSGNSFTGKLVVNQGSFGIGSGSASTLGSPAAFQADSITLNGGTLVNGNFYNSGGNFNNGGIFTLNANRGITLGSSGGTIQVGWNGAGRLNVAGAITGTGSLTKSDSGDLSLYGSNNYAGGTFITAGALSVGELVGNSSNEGSNNSLGTAAVNVSSGAQLIFAGNNLSIGNDITLNGAATVNGRQGALVGGYQDGGSNNTLTGTLTLAGTGDRTVSVWWTDKTLNLAGKVTGAGTLRIVNISASNSNEGSIVYLSNTTNDFSGGITVDSGGANGSNQTLRLGASNVIPDGAGKGNVAINGRLELGTFSETINGLTGSGVVSTGNGAVLTVGNNDATSTFSGTMNGTGALAKTGTGTLTLITGSNSYSGGTTINNGVLSVGVTNGLGSGTINFTGNATLRAGANITLSNAITLGTTSNVFDTNGNTLTLNGGISNSGAINNVIKAAGTGTLVLGGALNVTGGSDTDNPALMLGNRNGANFSRGTATITGTGSISRISTGWDNTANTLNFASTGTVTMSGDFVTGQGGTGSAGVVNHTAGTLTMQNLNLANWDGSYGAYNMSGGTLNTTNLRNGGNGNGNGNSYMQMTGGTVNVTTTTTFSRNGNGTNVLHVNGAGAQFNAGTSNINLGFSTDSTGIVTISSGLLTVNSNISLAQGNTSSTFGIVNLNGGTVRVNTIAGAGGSSIVNFNGGTLQANQDNVSIMSDLTSANIFSGGATIDTNGKNITTAQNLLAASGIGVSTIAVTAGGAGYLAAPVVKITGGGGTGATAVAVLTGGVVTGIQITSAGTGYTGTPTVSLVGGGPTSAATLGTITTAANAGSGGLTKTGSGTLTLSGANTYNGSTNVDGGILAFGGGTTTTSGSLLIHNGTVNVSGGAITTSNYISIGHVGTETGVMNVTSGSITTGSDFNVADVGTSTGTLNVSGTGLVVANGASLYIAKNTGTTGTVNLNGGTISTFTVGSGTGTPGSSTFNFNGGNLQARGNSAVFLAGHDTVNVRNGGAVIDTQNFAITIGQALTHSNIGGDNAIDGGLAKNGIGTLTLSGNNSYTGVTNVNAGTLVFGTGGSVYNSGANAGSISINNGGTVRIDRQDLFGGHTSVPTATITVNSGGLLLGNGFYNTLNNLTLNGGTLQMANGDNFWGSFALKGTVTVGGSSASNISSGGSTANFIRIGTNTAGGATIFDVGDSTGNANADLTISAQLRDNKELGGSFNDVASGLTKTGTGTLVLTGTNTYSGITTISGGTLQVSVNGTTATLGSGNVINNAALAFQRQNEITVSNLISGTGSVSQIGSGTLVLTNANTYTGATNVSTGTLRLTGSLSNTAISVASGATFSPTVSTSAGLSSGSAGASLALNSGAIFDMTSTNAGTINTFTLNPSANTNSAQALTLAGANLRFDLGSSSADWLTVNSGTAVVSGTNNIRFNTGSSLTSGTQTLISAASGLAGNFQFDGGSSLSVPAQQQIKNVGGTYYRLTLQNSGTAQQVVVSAAPSNLINIMPLGSSITAGAASELGGANTYAGGGYRSQLYQNLVNDGRFTPHFVGSATDLGKRDSSKYNVLEGANELNHEGHSGYTTTQILKNLNANGGDGGNNGGLWLASGNGKNPDYVTLSIGGNDYGANGSETTAPLKRTDAIVSQIQSLRPDAQVIVSNLFYRTQTSGGNVVGDLQNTYYNPGVQGMVFNHVLAGQHVSFYDAYSAVTPGNNMSTIFDGIHPDQAGYNAFANGWYDALANGSAFWTGSSGGTWNNQANFAQNYQRTTARQTALGASTDVHFNNNAAALSTTLGQNTSVRSVNFAAGATGAVTIGGANTLTLGAGGITVQAGTGAHTISSNVVLGTAQTWGNVSSNAFTVSGDISGSGNLSLVGSYSVELAGTLVGNTYTTTTQTVSGTGGFVLNGANSHSGGTTINAVTVAIGHNTALGSGTVAMNDGATLANNSSPLAVGNGFTLSGTTNGVTFTGSQNLTLSGQLGSAGAVKMTKTGASILTLSGDSGDTLAGGTTWNVTGGSYNSSTGLYDNVLAIGSARALGNSNGNVVNLDGGTLRFAANGGAGYVSGRTINVLAGGGAIDDGGFAFGEAGGGSTVAPTVTIASGATLGLVSSNQLVLSGVLSGSGAVTKFGSGTATLKGGSTYTGATTISGGTLVVGAAGANDGSAGALGRGDIGKTITVSAGATLTGTANNWFGNQENVGTLSTIAVNGGTLSTSRYTTVGTLSLNGATVTNSSTETNNSYQAFAFRGDVTVGGSSASTISANAATATTQGYHLGSNTTFNVADTTGNANADLIISAPLRDQSGDFANAAGGLTKSGAGMLTLSGANTHSGATTVNAGTLTVAGSIANSAVTVSNAGTTIASGSTGTLGSSLTVNSGAILAAGDAAAAGTATVAGATTLNNGSIFSWDISGNGTGYDKLVTASLAGEGSPGDAVFRIVAADSTFANTFWNQSRTWTDIFTTNGSNAISDWAGLFSVAVVNSSFQTVSPVNGSFRVSGSTLTWSAVPEVSNVLVGGLLGLGLLRRRRDGGGNLLPRKVTSRSSLHN
jgi:fibronectin-binding autotransporter adhesin